MFSLVSAFNRNKWMCYLYNFSKSHGITKYNNIIDCSKRTNYFFNRAIWFLIIFNLMAAWYSLWRTSSNGFTGIPKPFQNKPLINLFLAFSQLTVISHLSSFVDTPVMTLRGTYWTETTWHRSSPRSLWLAKARTVRWSRSLACSCIQMVKGRFWGGPWSLLYDDLTTPARGSW